MKKKSDEEFTITAYKKVYEAKINTQYLHRIILMVY